MLLRTVILQKKVAWSPCFVESRGDAFLNPKTINKPASKNIRILIAPVFHFVTAVDEQKLKSKLEALQDFSCSPP